jgi:hypothetical protein
MTDTNIKNLPEGEYFTEVGYSQLYPWVATKRTAKTATLAKVVVKKDPDWKPDFIPGGFCAHCTNQSDQTWLFDRIEHTAVTTIRLNNRGQWAHKGVRFIPNRATEFYDYNF